MIEVTLEEFIFWLVLLPLVGIAIYLMISAIKLRIKKRSLVEQIIQCHTCGNLYYDISKEMDPKCPECGRANGRGPSRRLG